MPLESKECCSFLSKSLTERESSGNNNNNKISSFFPSGYRTHHNNGLDLLETTLARSHSAREAREPARGALGIRRRERERVEKGLSTFLQQPTLLQKAASQRPRRLFGGQLRPAASILRWHQRSRLIISTYYEYKYSAALSIITRSARPSTCPLGSL